MTVFPDGRCKLDLSVYGKAAERLLIYGTQR